MESDAPCMYLTLYCRRVIPYPSKNLRDERKGEKGGKDLRLINTNFPWEGKGKVLYSPLEYK